ncbi:MAG: VWA domain-containing protein [Planctomycetaceae bacterium]|jgi:Mg-chelatase subunit ChlD|nr:VWA domain-containing protein [Planctomycetaceae bacterium]
MFLEFTQPVYLLGLVSIAVLAAAYKYSLIDFSRRQRKASLFVRSVIVTLLVFALAELTLILPSHQTQIVILADHSRSVDKPAGKYRDNMVEQLRRMIPADRFGGIVPFGTETETNIAEAVNIGLAMVSPDYVPHLVLISDGNETAGKGLETNAPLLSAMALPEASEPEIQVAELKMPQQVRQGEPFYIETVIQSNVTTDAAISLYRGAFKLLEEKKRLKPGENTYRFKQTIENQRQQEFTVTVQAGALPAAAADTRKPAAVQDTILENNRLSGVVFAGGKPKVLIIDSEPRTVRDLTSSLREQEITAEVRPPEGIPKTLNDLDNFDAVIFSSVPSTAMTVSQMKLLRTYVSELGGGFIMLGSEQSFGLGGYYKTPIEEILPVRCDFKKEQDKPSLAICLVIDRSGSMGGQKMELAKDAAKAAVELLSPKDFAAVIAFDHESHVVCPMQSTASSSAILSAISTIEPAGGTNIYPGLADAYEQLRRTPARLKHVILLTDGHSSPGDFEGMTRQLARDQITVSTVGVGEADNDLLKMIAETGRGRHYSCDDPQAIPQIFAKETVTASKSAVKETPFVPVLITAAAALRQIDFSQAPPLLGYVVTKPKPTGEFILASGTGDPLLMWWRFGLGHSVTFSSDAKSKWAAEWIGWEHYGKFWAQVIRYAMRQQENRNVSLDIEKKTNHIHLTFDAIGEQGLFINKAEGKAIIIQPDLSKQETAFVQTAPGRYEASFPLPAINSPHQNAGGIRPPFTIQTVFTYRGQVLANLSRSVMTGYPDEWRIRPVNRQFLQQLAEKSGGLFNASAEQIAALQTDKTADKTIPLWTYLLTAAAFLLVFDVLLRRIEIM